MRMRKKRRGDERLLALSALFLAPEDCGGNISAFYGQDQPFRLEIGCGKGEFIRKMSKRDADYNYIAIEKVRDVAVVAAEKYAADRALGSMDCHGGWKAPDGTVYDGVRWDIPMKDRGNVRFMNCDAEKLNDIFNGMEFDRVYANFSDPWTKSGHASRRLTHPDFLKKYLRLLRQGGAFCFKTDNDELFEFSVEAITGEEGFEVTYITRDLHADERAKDNIVTEYERNFSSQGIPIKYIEAVKK